MLTRRQAISGMTLALGTLAGGARGAMAQTAAQSASEPQIKEIPSTEANRHRTSLHQEVHLKGTPQRIYEILLDQKQFAACSGMPALIDPKEGGAFSMFSGLIVGRNIELVPAQRIVQAWRPSHWDPGVYSLVEFQLKADGAGSSVILNHKGFPEGDYDSLFSGWYEHYWERLEKYLA